MADKQDEHSAVSQLVEIGNRQRKDISYLRKTIDNNNLATEFQKFEEWKISFKPVEFEQIKELRNRFNELAVDINAPLDDAIKQINLASEQIKNFEKFIRPSAIIVQQMVENIVHIIGPYERIFRDSVKWQLSLAERMQTIQLPWLIETSFDVSASGFARLSRLSDAVHNDEPFSEELSEFLVQELGNRTDGFEETAALERDTSAIAGGMKPEIISFPPSSFANVIVSAGFSFAFKSATPPQAISQEDVNAVFDPMHWQVMYTVESSLRQIIQNECIAEEGNGWEKKRINGNILAKLKQRQSEDREFGRPVYNLIQYSDFMDLADIICQNNNWKLFERYFSNRDDFRVSLTRLHPVRKAIAHNRPIGRADTVTLVSEATRILRSIGVSITTV